MEWGRLESRRPRCAGSNARLGEHGIAVRPSIARITLEDGSSGFGSCWASREASERLIGRPVSELFAPSEGVPQRWRAFDFPLWDLAARRADVPVYALAAEARVRGSGFGVRYQENGEPKPGVGSHPLTPAAARASPGSRVGRPQHLHPLTVPCYDTSLYFDDLHLGSTEEAAECIAGEAREGFERGHRAFKMKVGRGARHLPLEEGTQRDIAMVRAVREAVGPDSALMMDANNGYNLNLAKRVLAETAEYRIFWLEEPFHEDPVLYRDLKEWMERESIPTLIADGEGDASPHLLEWARDGLVDVVQYDIFGYGFTRWMETGQQLDAWGVRTAPHHYGGHLGNYAACHLAPAIRRFTFVEWDHCDSEWLDCSGYTLEEGRVQVPDTPGFGLALDESAFQQAVQNSGYRVP